MRKDKPFRQVRGPSRQAIGSPTGEGKKTNLDLSKISTQRNKKLTSKSMKFKCGEKASLGGKEHFAPKKRAGPVELTSGEERRGSPARRNPYILPGSNKIKYGGTGTVKVSIGKEKYRKNPEETDSIPHYRNRIVLKSRKPPDGQGEKIAEKKPDEEGRGSKI